MEKHINVDHSKLKRDSTKVLIEQVCTNKEVLILMFEDLFGKEQRDPIATSMKA